MIRYTLCCLCILSLPLFAAEPAPLSLIETKDGGRLEVRGVQKQGETLTFEVAGQKLSLPMSAVSRYVSLEEAPDKFRLFHDGDPSETTKTAKELMELRGEAVVTVKTSVGLGSGFFIHEDGFLLTNAHVIEGEHPESLTVCQFVKNADGIEEKAFTKVRIVAVAGLYDIALLKVEAPQKFPWVSLADSTRVQQGDRVFALGSPQGLSRSTAEGTISQANRGFIDGFYLQTTTALSPGNSGGPLFNLQGQVIGINTLKLVDQGTEGISFCIPTDWVKTFLRNRDAFAFDPTNTANGVRYLKP